MNNQKEETRHKPRYGMVLLALIVLTGIEVGVSYLPEGVKLPILIVMAVAKAALVVLWFMHLKFDARLYAVIFVVGILFIIPEIIFLIVGNPLPGSGLP
jgi:cytochrome c oxidase subunit IV